MAFEYTVRQCAEKLGVSETRIHQLINEGTLPAEYVAGRYFVDEDAVRARAASSPSPGRPPKRLKADPRRFTLMNREHEVFDFVYDERANEFIEVQRTFDLARAPLGLVSPRGKKVSLKALTDWWAHRSIPLSRSGMEAKMASLGMANPSRLPFKSLGLSLSDQYWIRPEGEDLDWRSINFFNNPFPEMEIASWLDQVGLRSPDNTSEGELSKRWVRRDGTPVLLKGGRSLNQEPYNEVVATHLYRRLLSPGDYVPYELVRLADGTVACACENFLTDEEEYVPAYHVMRTRAKVGGRSDYQHYLECCSRLGAEGAESALAKMIATDDLLGNTDRHLRNFGLIRNVTTMEYRPAPLFDAGSSLLSDKTAEALIGGDITFATKPFAEDPNQQLRLVNDYSWFDAESLEGFAKEACGILANNPALVQRTSTIKRFIEHRAARLAVIAS